jgi:hypothetical protein
MRSTQEILAEFVEKYGQTGVESTSAAVVNFSGTLYNVDGSTKDPKIDGESWKKLLQSYGIDGDCYVTNTTPSGNTHPDFNVGGHVTPRSDGEVQVGGKCYLMPLCSWHNNSARDGVAFSHTETEMLQLSGYMQSELALTFIARLPSDNPFSIIYEGDEEWETQTLSAEKRTDEAALQLPGRTVKGLPRHYVLLRQEERDGKVFYVVESSNLRTDQ